MRVLPIVQFLPAAVLLALGAGSAVADASKSEATPAAAATPPATVDPLEQLRQRLAGRLVRSAAGDDPSSPYDLKVVARTTPAPAAAMPAARPAPRSAPRAATAPLAAAALTSPGAPAAAAAQAWSYSGSSGPQTWGQLKPEFSLCGNGQRQSPIDLRGGLAVDLEPVKFDYQSGKFAVVDNGLNVSVRWGGGSAIEIGGRRFELQHTSFHRPAEHRIDGRLFEMSAHLVHRDAEGRTAIVAVQFDKGPALPAAQQVLNHLPLEKMDETAARVPLDPKALLPTDRRYYTYMGSLTTPPCSEGVQWIVMRQPLAMAPEQLELFARVYPQNARPVQALAGRRILQSQ
jgi:carbonic anhydrase